MPFMTRSDVVDAYIARGWFSTQGNLYFDGLGGGRTVHPHLHLIINGEGTVRIGKDIRMAVKMLAFSDGGQHRGGGGTTFINNCELTRRDWRYFMARCNGDMADELAWIIDYFRTG